MLESEGTVQGRNRGRVIRGKVVVDARIDAVWEAWTTEEGLKSFFAPDCNLDLRVGGAFELLFDLDAEPGQRGSEGCTLLGIQPKAMLSFTWNAPPHLPNVREQLTHVVVRFRELSPATTEVTLTHDGWGEGKEWDEAYDYFTRAWNDIVLPRLAYRFSVGPVDWSDPPNVG